MNEETKYGLIYKTTNLINGKIYIGQTTRIDNFTDNKYLGSGNLIVKAIKKYGKENFKSEMICYCSSQEKLNEEEQFNICKFNSTFPDGYNLSSGAGQGGKHHHSTKEKFRTIMTGKRTGKNHPMFGKPGPMTGKKLSDSQKKVLSEFAKSRVGVKNPMFGKPQSLTVRLAVAESNRNRVWSEESKKKISEANKGNKSNLGKTRNELVKLTQSIKMSGENNPMFGKKHSEETKQKIRDARKKKLLFVNI